MYVDCPHYAVPRIKLLEELSGLLQSLDVDMYANKEITINKLLNGSNDLNMNEKIYIYSK